MPVAHREAARAATRSGRERAMKLAAWPRAFAARSSSCVERADPLQQLELVAQVRAHHLRAVRRDRERDAVLDEGAERVADRVLVGERLREQVRRGADLEHDAGLAQQPHQGRVVRRRGCRGRSGRAGGARRPRRSPRAPVAPSSPTWIVTPRPAARAVSTIGRDRRVVVAQPAGARPGDVDADDAAVGPGDRLVDDDRVLPRVERAVHHQDQPGAHLRVLEPTRGRGRGSRRG